jgi:hypothetical protein
VHVYTPGLCGWLRHNSVPLAVETKLTQYLEGQVGMAVEEPEYLRSGSEPHRVATLADKRHEDFRGVDQAESKRVTR